MGETNLSLEIQTPASQNDGSKVLQAARTAHPKGITRRNFLKLSGVAFASWLLSGCMPGQQQADQENASLPVEKFLPPELVHNVEVYGLNKKITSEEQIINLYDHINEQFATQNGIAISNNIAMPFKVEQRKKLLNPNERYLEVVVRQSAYDSFLQRKDETQVDFVEWIQMHVDAMNMCFENAKPPSKMKSVLRRIVVVDDNLASSFWNESAYRQGKAPALDVEWRTKFSDKYPLDTDACWAIADDYRVDTRQETIQCCLWSVRHQNGKTIFGWPPGAKDYKRVYEFPERNNSLSGKNGVWLDFALIHEWSNYLTNLPDQYFFDIHDKNPSRFANFLVETGNSFQEPYLSPYLSMFLTENIRRKSRSWSRFFQNEVYNLSERPTNNTIVFTDNTGEVSNIKVHKVVAEVGYIGRKTFLDLPNQEQSGNQIVLGNELFDDRVENGAHVWLFRVGVNGAEKQLFFPAATFQMSKFAGVDNANYRVEFTGYDNQNKKNQIMDMVDDTDLHQYLNDKNKNGDQLYAKMKVDGTNTWFVWFLRN